MVLQVYELVSLNIGGIDGIYIPVPGSHVDSNCEAVREYLLRSLDVNVEASSRGSRVEVWVVRSEFAAE